MENTAKLYTPHIDMSLPHDVSEEFALPDYMPEIRRIVSCSAEVLPESRSIRDGEASLSGIVTYSVLYVGEDGGLCCAPLNSEYVAKFPFSPTENAVYEDFAARTCAESVTCRATAPRKLSVTCRMRSRLFGTRALDIGDEVSRVGSSDETTPADLMSILRKNNEAECCAVKFAAYTGGTTGEFRDRDGVKIISCDGSAGINDVKLDSGVAIVRGDVYISCLTMDEDGVYSSVRSKTPFEERVPVSFFDKISSDARTTPTASVRCASVSVSGGDGGAFTWEAEYDIDVTVSIIDTCSYADDAYSTLYASSIEAEETDIASCVKNHNTRMSINGASKIRDEEKSVSVTFGKATCNRCDFDGEGHAIFSGTCTVSAVLVGGGEAVCEDVEIPFTYRCDAGEGEAMSSSGLCTPTVMYTDARIDGDKLICDAELSIEALVCRKSRVKHITRIMLEAAEKSESDESRITVYFPYPDETLWDIGKRYRCEERCISSAKENTAVIIMK